MDVVFTVSVAVFLACASVYAGTIWCVRLFLYRSWVGLTPDNVTVHFTGPVAAATRFFTLLFPVATLSGVLAVILAWWSWAAFALLLALVWLYVTLVVFRHWLAPVNKRIETTRSGTELTGLLQVWMRWNSVRWGTTTAVWACAVWGVFAAGDVGRVAR